MNARKVIGKKITRVVQKRRKFNSGMATEIIGIELDDGSILRFMVLEAQDTDYGIVGLHIKR